MDILFDTFLRLGLQVGCCSFAYADDGFLMTAADSRRRLEDRANRAYGSVLDWSKENRLSVLKTKAMLLEGFVKADLQ